jgi:non-canonical purine NTP pyrophosphatase (RdgB/HAM1 family)
MRERLVIGSRNPGKIDEWGKYFSEFGIKADNLFTFSFIPEPKEVGETFIENARIKASEYAKLTKTFVFADDGGYEIDYLNGWPGVKSRRILPGEKEGTDQDLIDSVLTKMKGVPLEERTVRLTSAVALSDPLGEIIFEDIASSKGYISEIPGPVLIKGYPFRSIHFLPELNKTYAELTKEELKSHSHKRPMAAKLAKFLLEYNHA